MLIFLNHAFLKYGLKLHNAWLKILQNSVYLTNLYRREIIAWACWWVWVKEFLITQFSVPFVAFVAAKVKSFWKVLKKYFQSEFRDKTTTNCLESHQNSTAAIQSCYASFQSVCLFVFKILYDFKYSTCCECDWAVVFLLRTAVILINPTAFPLSCSSHSSQPEPSLIFPTLVKTAIF